MLDKGEKICYNFDIFFIKDKDIKMTLANKTIRKENL